MRRTKMRMMATTSRMWMNPPIVYEVTMPSSHRTIKMMAMIVSICLKGKDIIGFRSF